MSPNIFQLTGYQPEQFINDSKFWIDHIHPEDIDRLSAESIQVLTNDRSTYEYRFLCQNGSYIWVRDEVKLIRGEKGEPLETVGYWIDITAQKQTEDALRESELRLKQVSEHTQGWIWEVDREGVYTYASPVIKSLLGYKPEEIVGKKHFYDFIAPDIRREIMKAVFEIFSRKESFKKLENPNIHKDGHIVILESSGCPVIDKQDNLIGYRGVDSDITEQKNTEEFLRTQNRYHKIRADLWKIANDSYGSESDIIQKMLTFVGPELNVSRATFLKLNPDIKEYVVESQWFTADAGPSQNQSISFRKAKLLFGRKYAVLPRDLVPGIKQYITRKFKKDGIYSYLAVPYSDQKNPSGLFTFSECRYARQWSQIEIDALLEIVNIITLKSEEIKTQHAIHESEARLMESEERFRNLYENATVGLYRTTRDGKILLANHALISMLGYSSFDELAVRNLEVNGFEPSYPRAQFIELIEKEGEIRGFESNWKRRDGSIIFVRESAGAVRDSHGKTLYYDGTVEDITESRQAEGALITTERIYRHAITKAGGVPYQIDYASRNYIFLGEGIESLTGYSPTR